MVQDTDDGDRKRSSSSTRRYQRGNSGPSNYKRSSPRGGPGGGRGGGDHRSSTNSSATTNPLEVYIGNLPPDGDVAEETLRRFLTMYLNMEGNSGSGSAGPPITNIDVSPPNAWVKCATSTHYQTLLNLNGKISYYNSELKIAPSRRRQTTSSTSGGRSSSSATHSSTDDAAGNNTRQPRHQSQQQLRSNGASDNIDKIKTELLDEKIMNYLLSDSHASPDQPTSCVPIGKYIKSIGLQDLLKNEHGGLRKFLQERPNRYTIINDDRATIADKHKAALFFIKPVIATTTAGTGILGTPGATGIASTPGATIAANGGGPANVPASTVSTSKLQADLATTKAELEKANAKILELQTQILDDKIYNFLNSPTTTSSSSQAVTENSSNGSNNNNADDDNGNEVKPIPTSSVSLGIHLKSLGLSDFMKKEHGGLKRFLQERDAKYEITTTPPPIESGGQQDVITGSGGSGTGGATGGTPSSPPPKAVFWVTKKPNSNQTNESLANGVADDGNNRDTTSTLASGATKTTTIVSNDAHRVYEQISQLLLGYSNKRSNQADIGNKLKSLGLSHIVQESGGLKSFIRSQPNYFRIILPRKTDPKYFVVELIQEYDAKNTKNAKKTISDNKKESNNAGSTYENGSSGVGNIHSNTSIDESMNDSKQTAVAATATTTSPTKVEQHGQHQQTLAYAGESIMGVTPMHTPQRMTTPHSNELQQQNINGSAGMTSPAGSPSATTPSARMIRVKKLLQDTQEKLKIERANMSKSGGKGGMKGPMESSEGDAHAEKLISEMIMSFTAEPSSDTAPSSPAHPNRLNFGQMDHEQKREHLEGEIKYLTSAFATDELRVEGDGNAIVRRISLEIIVKEETVEVDFSLGIPNEYPEGELEITTNILGRCSEDIRKCVVDALSALVQQCKLELKELKGDEAILSIFTTVDSWVSFDWPMIQAKQFPFGGLATT